MRRLHYLATEFLKLSQTPILLPVFVPREALSSIRTLGLLSAEKLIQDPMALHLARPGEEEEFRAKVESDLRDPEGRRIREGISAFFTLPDPRKISPKHHIRRRNLIPIQINLSALLQAGPLKLLGVELLPYHHDMTEKELQDRERELTPEEVSDYTERSPTSLWRHYDRTQTSHYASDVPHLIILPPKKMIAPDFLILPP